MNALLRGSAAVILIAAGIAAGEHGHAQNPPRAEPRPITPRPPLGEGERAVVELFQNSAPSVAYITTEVPVQGVWFGGGVARGAGSGFIWDAAGHVVTNNHVVEGARRVFVQLNAGDPIPADVIGRAPEYDLAVVRLHRVPKDLRPIPIGASKDVRVGQSVYAIGNPYGLQRTLTHGIVSALDRDLPTAGYREVAGVIQIDAAINPGNSGGPLLDSAGRLIGVNSAIRSASGGSAGVGFAIPSDLVNRIVPSLISRGRAPVPGIGIVPYAPEIVARAGIQGVVIQQVVPNSPAGRAGLAATTPKQREVGDVIVAVNGRAVETPSQLANELDRIGVGNAAELTIVRAGKARKLRVPVVDLAP